MVLSELLTELINWSLMVVHQYGAWSVFFVVILEEVFVPIPSMLVLMGAGFLLIEPGIAINQAAWNIFWLVTIPASIASTIGSFFAYGIGYYGGKPVIKRMQRFLGVGWDDIKKAEKRMEKGKKTWATIAALRAIPFFPIAVVSLAAGVLRLSWKWYAVATFIGSLPRTFILAYLGWWIGGEFIALAQQLNIVEDLILAVVIAAALIIIYKYHKHYKKPYEKMRSVQKKGTETIKGIANKRKIVKGRK